MSRREVARELRADVRLLRHWERCGLLPKFGSIPSRLYIDRAEVVLAARRRLSMQRVREALAIGGC